MFCKNCGQVLAENSTVCDACGNVQDNAPQQVAPQVPQAPMAPTVQQSAPYAQPPQPQKPKKSKKGLIIVLAVIAAIIVLFVALGSCGGPETSGTQEDVTFEPWTPSEEDADADSSSSSSAVDTEKADTSTFDGLIASEGISYTATLSGDGTRAFIMKNATNSSIDIQELKADGDVVKEMVEIVYFPMTDYTDEQKETFDTQVKEQYGPADELDCCTVTYDTDGDFYVLKIHSTGLENVDTVSKLADAKVLTITGEAATISMQQSADGLISLGYIEKK
ncbi:MAG: hypothetical protein IKB73_06330 [Ruminococcus sp.]|nr:hypothetical protein [Ruminococcus sp.]